MPITSGASALSPGPHAQFGAIEPRGRAAHEIFRLLGPASEVHAGSPVARLIEPYSSLSAADFSGPRTLLGERPKGSFANDKLSGILIEQTFTEFLGIGWPGQFEDTRRDANWRKRGVDYLLHDERFEQPMKLEVKGDFKTTGNFVVEQVSNTVTGDLGWLYTSECDVLAYFLVASDELLLFDFAQLRAWVTRSAPGFVTREARTRVATQGEVVYNTEIRCIKASNALKYHPFGRVVPLAAWLGPDPGRVHPRWVPEAPLARAGRLVLPAAPQILH